ncbi:RecT family recombinase [uncultured Anaerococcus sp.]|uniref:RecT family recombinase n=1 Tax=uncultured Anaerococcus sp. TaxID=293428 RepID=UPI0025DA5569|nr:RecT family recombinase [uncultured Anaerococcus sp.]
MAQNQVQTQENNRVRLESRIVSQAISQYQAMVEKKVFDVPENYSYKNAIQAARYLISKPIEKGPNKGKAIVDLCTEESILKAIMEMAQKGLNPDKKQCYFIPYGNTCTLSISYQGNVALAKRGGEDIGETYGYAVYKNDKLELVFDPKKGVIQVKSYVPDISKWTKSDITGAFAVITDRAGNVKYTEYMTMEQIKDSWDMGGAKGKSPAHQNFPDQQAIKTVKSRAVKSFVNTADDSDIVSSEEKSITYTDKTLNKELESKANSLELDINMEQKKAPAIEEKTQKPEEIKPKEAPANVDTKTGEIIDEVIDVEEINTQSDFFDEDFTEIKNPPF